MTSVLTRALETQWSILRELNQLWIETIKSWRLNERHYGELTGLNKSEMAKIHGEEQVKIWRRSFAVPPPPMKRNDPRDSKLDPRYSKVPEHEIPLGESLLNTVERVIPFWEKEMKPRLLRGEKILLVAHGNSIRALIYHLEVMTPEQILEVNIPTATPIAYSLDKTLKVIEKKMLGDPETIKNQMSRVLAQGKAD